MTNPEHGKKARFTITIDPGLYEQVQDLGKGRRGGVSGVVEDCIKAHLAGLSKEPAPLVVTEATTPEEVQQVLAELLKPEVVLEAMKVARKKSVHEDDLLGGREEKPKDNKGKKHAESRIRKSVVAAGN